MGVTDTKTGLPEKGAVATESKKGRMGLFSKERALYLVDHPTDLARFSWWFFLAGVAVAYWLHQRYGYTNFFYSAEKMLAITVGLLFWFPANWVKKRVKSGVIPRDSALLYLMLLAGDSIVFLGTVMAAHMAFSFFI